MPKKDRIPEVHFYEWSVSRWTSSTTRAMLDPAGRGIYRELLDLCYAQGKIPRDHEILARMCGCTVDEFERAWKIISRHFSADDHSRDHLRNDFADVYRKNYFDYVEKQRERARKGGAANSKRINGIRSGGLDFEKQADIQPAQKKQAQYDTIRYDTRREDTKLDEQPSEARQPVIEKEPTPPSSAESPQPEAAHQNGRGGGGFSNETKNSPLPDVDKSVDIGKEQFPLTAAAIDKHFPGYGSLMADQTAYACQMVDKNVTDQQVADGVRVAYYPKQVSPGLFKTSVPRLVKEWMVEREKEMAKASKPKPKWSNRFEDNPLPPPREPKIPPQPLKSEPVMEVGRHKTGQLHGWLESMRDKRA